MPLPFLKPKNMASIIIERRKPVPDEQDGKEGPHDSIKTCAEDLIKAVHEHDVDGVAAAMHSAFTILESQPHDEAPHEETEESQ